MKHPATKLSRLLALPLASLALAHQGWAQAAPPAPAAPPEGQVVELSPFVLEEDSNVGYRATSTLAGSRLRMPLRDVGSAIQVVTKEFLEDTGATDAGSLLSYTMNTETGGAGGNFAGGGFDTGGNRTDQNAARINPQFNQRVRGLGAATLTRDFYITNIPFDTYNSTQVTINRGPNAILFGVGSPGGIIDNSLNKASLAKDTAMVSARIGDNASYRVNFDINRVLIKDRLALRLAGLDEETKYDQKPAYDGDARIYAAAEAVLFKNQNSSFLDRTVIRANYEKGTLKSNPLMVVPPRSLFHNWWTTLPADYFLPYTGQTMPAIFTTNFVPQYTASLTKTPAGINTNTTPTLAWTTIFDQGALVFQNPDDQVPNAGSASYPNANGLQGRLTFFPGNIRYEWFSTQAAEGQNYATGFIYPSLQDRNVFDYRKKLFSGNTSFVRREFEAQNIALEQLFFKKRNAGIEIGYDRQKWNPTWQTPVDDSLQSIYSNADIAIDISERLGNGDPNPNLGRPFVRIFDLGGYAFQRLERESARATAFYELDFKDVLGSGWGRWLGKHTVTGFWGTQSSTNQSRTLRASWNTDEVPISTAFSGLGGNFFRAVNGVVYVGPSALSASGPEQVRLEAINISIPQVGDTYNLWYQGPTGRASISPSIKNNNFSVEHVNVGGNLTKNEIDSEVLTIQSRLLNEHIVGLVGWRTDESTSFERLTTEQIQELTGNASRTLPDGNLKPENYILQSDPSSVEEGDTFTSSIVAHVPDSWTDRLPLAPRFSLHWGQSENFSPAGLRRDVYLNVIGPPVGETREYGFTVELARKHFIRFNWFETTSTGSDAGLNAGLVTNRTAYRLERMVAEPQNSGFTFAETKALMMVDLPPGTDPIPNINSYAQLEAAIIGLLPGELQDKLRYRVELQNGTYRVESETFAGQVATAAVKAEGFEIDLVTNPTPNWRIMFNVAQQETVQSDSAPKARVLAETIVGNLQASGLANLRVSPTFNAAETVFNEFNRLVLVPLNGIVARDGTISLEQRKWRANLVTNYRFAQSSRFKGFSVGGGIRWQDKVGIGYSQLYSPETGIIPDLSKPFFAPSEWNGDMWFTYERKINERVNWKVQLNFRNLFGDHNDIPVRANPDGSIAAIRIPNDKTWFLTNTFEF